MGITLSVAIMRTSSGGSTSTNLRARSIRSGFSPKNWSLPMTNRSGKSRSNGTQAGLRPPSGANGDERGAPPFTSDGHSAEPSSMPHRSHSSRAARRGCERPRTGFGHGLRPQHIETCRQARDVRPEPRGEGSRFDLPPAYLETAIADVLSQASVEEEHVLGALCPSPRATRPRPRPQVAIRNEDPPFIRPLAKTLNTLALDEAGDPYACRTGSKMERLILRVEVQTGDKTDNDQLEDQAPDE
jgi:hypothetical protein